jgi:hypothetical protein
MIEFRNEFHGTSAVSRKRVGDFVQRAYVRGIWRKLCGIKGCQCCGSGGVRGGVHGFEPWGGDWTVFEVVRWGDER